MKPTIDNIIKILSVKGKHQYGSEAVSQLEHALQCATLAENNGASKELIIACLLHDIGHLLHDLGEDPAIDGIDDRHEYIAANFLNSTFDRAITEPIRLHVDAKRYLCATDPNYWDSLSPASKKSLELQGGIFSLEEAKAFISQPHATEAVQLRIWDDRAKVRGYLTPDLNHFFDMSIFSH